MNKTLYRIGQSSDIHRFESGDFITVGGERIPCHHSVIAHSDGDALVHAIGEAILGALCQGDLGNHFPDTDERYNNIDSLILLNSIYKIMDEQGYEINNVDSMIMIEQIKMAPLIQKMRTNISRVLHTDIDNISIKATRGEKLGFVGQDEGYECRATVLLKLKNK